MSDLKDFDIKDGTLYRYVGPGGDIVVPDGVTCIYEAFKGCESITSIILPIGIETIDANAFQDCKNLVSITLPEGLKDIYFQAFDGCTSLTSIILPEGMSRISFTAFAGCTSLVNIVIPKSVICFGASAFSRCKSLQTIQLPQSQSSIEQWTFFNCASLKDIKLHDKVTSIDKEAFKGCSSLTNIDFPQSLRYIGLQAFANCTSLTSITIPAGVTKVRGSAFLGCTALTSATILSAKTELFDAMFQDCTSLKTVALPDGIPSIRDHMFENCSSLEEIAIPQGVTEIGAFAFAGCTSLKKIVIPEGVTKISSSAFQGCTSLASVDIPQSLKSIGNSAFEGCTSITEVPTGVSRIGSAAFRGCTGLTSITIPVGVKTIGEHVFNRCKNVTSVVFHEKVTAVNDRAFSLCDSLTDVYYMGTPKQKEKITIRKAGNQKLIDANWHFCPQEKPAKVSKPNDTKVADAPTSKPKTKKQLVKEYLDNLVKTTPLDPPSAADMEFDYWNNVIVKDYRTFHFKDRVHSLITGNKTVSADCARRLAVNNSKMKFFLGKYCKYVKFEEWYFSATSRVTKILEGKKQTWSKVYATSFKQFPLSQFSNTIKDNGRDIFVIQFEEVLDEDAHDNIKPAYAELSFGIHAEGGIISSTMPWADEGAVKAPFRFRLVDGDIPTDDNIFTDCYGKKPFVGTPIGGFKIWNRFDFFVGNRQYALNIANSAYEPGGTRVIDYKIGQDEKGHYIDVVLELELCPIDPEDYY